MIREYIEEFGTAPDGRLFRTYRGGIYLPSTLWQVLQKAHIPGTAMQSGIWRLTAAHKTTQGLRRNRWSAAVWAGDEACPRHDSNVRTRLRRPPVLLRAIEG